MANIVKTYTMVNGQPADATQVNKNFDDIITGVGDTATLHPTTLPASDVYAWAKTPTAPAGIFFNCGSFTGDGTTNRAIAVGFQPKLIYVWGIAAVGASYRIDATDGRVLLTASGNDLLATSVEPGLALSSSGFVTGDYADYSNSDTVKYRWEAWG